jgi:hypothetical protein
MEINGQLHIPPAYPRRQATGSHWVEIAWDPVPVWKLWKRKIFEYFYPAGNIA